MNIFPDFNKSKYRQILPRDSNIHWMDYQTYIKCRQKSFIDMIGIIKYYYSITYIIMIVKKSILANEFNHRRLCQYMNVANRLVISSLFTSSTIQLKKIHLIRFPPQKNRLSPPPHPNFIMAIPQCKALSISD